jgi:iron complex transport system substrate-binding protein
MTRAKQKLSQDGGTGRRICVLLLLSVLGCAPAPPTAVATAARKIASTSLAADELLLLLAPDSIAALSTSVDSPSSNWQAIVPDDRVFSVRAIPRVAANAEHLVSLGVTDVITATYNSPSLLPALRDAHVRAQALPNPQTFDMLIANIIKVGDIAQRAEPAERLANAVRTEVLLTRQAAARTGWPTRPPRVLFWAYGFTSGPQTLMGAMLDVLGLSNVASEANIQGNAKVPKELALALDPDFVVLTAEASEASLLRADPLLSQMRAVRMDKMLSVPSKYIGSVSPFALCGLRELAQVMAQATGEAWPEIDGAMSCSR